VEKKDAEVARDKCSSLWHVISRCVIYLVVAFFAVIVGYYVVMRAGARPALLPSSGEFLPTGANDVVNF